MKRMIPEHKEQQFRAEAAATPYPRERIIDILREIQLEHGWVPDEGIELAANIVGISPLQIEEVATFYDKIFRRPVGKRVIHVCDSICCWTRGSEELMKKVQEVLGINAGETTADGVFTLLPTCCLGACGSTPAMMIGFNTYGPVALNEVEGILQKEREGIA